MMAVQVVPGQAQTLDAVAAPSAKRTRPLARMRNHHTGVLSRMADATHASSTV
jgi:hypothetical protein